MKTVQELRAKRKRYKLKKSNPDAFRFVIHRSLNHVYAEIIDCKGESVAAASSMSKKNKVYNLSRTEKAKWVFESVAEKFEKIASKIENKKGAIYVDTGKFRYHGVIKEVVEHARKKLSLEF